MERIKRAMKFKFSIKSLFITTTVFAVMMGIARWLDLISHWRLVGAVGLYILVYLSIVCLFFGPRYAREFMQFREDRNSQQLQKARLEEEAKQLLAAARAKKQDAKESES